MPPIWEGWKFLKSLNVDQTVENSLLHNVICLLKLNVVLSVSSMLLAVDFIKLCIFFSKSLKVGNLLFRATCPRHSVVQVTPWKVPKVKLFLFGFSPSPTFLNVSRTLKLRLTEIGDQAVVAQATAEW